MRNIITILLLFIVVVGYTQNLNKYPVNVAKSAPAFIKFKDRIKTAEFSTPTAYDNYKIRVRNDDNTLIIQYAGTAGVGTDEGISITEGNRSHFIIVSFLKDYDINKHAQLYYALDDLKVLKSLIAEQSKLATTSNEEIKENQEKKQKEDEAERQKLLVMAEKDRLEKEANIKKKLEAESKEQALREQQEKEMLAKAEKEKLNLEKERIASEKETKRLEKEREAAIRKEDELKAEQERIAKIKEAQKKKQQEEALAKAEKERIALEERNRRLEKEKELATSKENELKIAQEKAAFLKEEKKRKEKEEADRIAQEKAEALRLAKEKKEAEDARKKLAAIEAEKERLEKLRIEKEKKDAENKARLAAIQAEKERLELVRKQKEEENKYNEIGLWNRYGKQGINVYSIPEKQINWVNADYYLDKDTLYNYEASQEVLAKADKKIEAKYGAFSNKVSIELKDIYFKGPFTYYKIKITNPTDEDFLTGAVVAHLYDGDKQHKLELKISYFTYIGHYPLIKPKTEKYVVIVTRTPAVENTDDVVLYIHERREERGSAYAMINGETFNNAMGGVEQKMSKKVEKMVTQESDKSDKSEKSDKKEKTKKRKK